MKTTNETYPSTEARAQLGDDGHTSTQIMAMLAKLHEAVEEIRAQLAGTTKSHFTVEEVAEMTGRASYTIRSWITAKKIKAQRVTGTGPRGRLLIPREELKKLITQAQGENIPAVLAK